MSEIICGNCLDVLDTFPINSFQTVVTSPPYWMLRSYLPADHPDKACELGLESTPEEYIRRMVRVFRKVRRVLRYDGTLWLNLADSLLNKQLVGIPWRVALALQADGWILRSDIIWCLSGGTWLYTRTQKGDMPMSLKDAARLDPSTVKLWNGTHWVQVLGWSRSERQGIEVELVLRSGERISCTPTHKFPTGRGLIPAGELQAGEVLERVMLPEPDCPRDCAIDADAAWLAGLYIADGSMSGDTIQISGNARQEARWLRVKAIAGKFGGSATRTTDGNKMEIRVYGKVLRAILGELVTGKIAKDKGFSPRVWRYSNGFVKAMLEGYLSGDGYWDAKKKRWRLGFTRNYKLERDLRTACARLGWHLICNMSSVEYNGRRVPTFRGEIRLVRSGHGNEKNSAEIVEVRKSRCRHVYDVGVEGEPHVFSLASGILTHNSKTNSLPESVRDRPTRSHEYLFLFAKATQYYYDQYAIREPSVGRGGSAANFARQTKSGRVPGKRLQHRLDRVPTVDTGTRNKRSVWAVPVARFKGAHFATFSPKLIEPCIRAGTSAHGCCPRCAAPFERVVESAESPEYEYKKIGIPGESDNRGRRTGAMGNGLVIGTVGWRPTCECDAGDPVPCSVLDPFGGAGTTGLVARQLGQRYTLIELNSDYCKIARLRLAHIQPELSTTFFN